METKKKFQSNHKNPTLTLKEQHIKTQNKIWVLSLLTINQTRKKNPEKKSIPHHKIKLNTRQKASVKN